MVPDDRQSVASIGSKGSKGSRKSATAIVRSMSNSLRRFSVKSVATTRSVAEKVNVQPGDNIETIAICTMREGEALTTAVVMEIPAKTALSVIEVGCGRRVKIQIIGSEREGWVSTKTGMNEPLVVKVHGGTRGFDTFEVGGQHEVKSAVTVREQEDLTSPILGELIAGTLVKIIEVGINNPRRAKIVCIRMVEESGPSSGWISTVTQMGELLIGKMKDQSDKSRNVQGSNAAKIKTILQAAMSGDVAVLRKTLESSGGFLSSMMHTKSVYVNCTDLRGKTALMYSAAFGHLDVVRYLVSRKDLDAHCRDDTQKTALHYAAKRVRVRGSEEFDDEQASIVRVLLAVGSFLEARDHNGCTPIMFAVANGYSAATQALITAKANVNVRDFEGHTPLDYAVNFQELKIATLLKSHGGVGELRLSHAVREAACEGGDAVEVADESQSTRAPPSEVASLAPTEVTSTAPMESMAPSDSILQEGSKELLQDIATDALIAAASKKEKPKKSEQTGVDPTVIGSADKADEKPEKEKKKKGKDQEGAKVETKKLTRSKSKTDASKTKKTAKKAHEGDERRHSGHISTAMQEIHESQDTANQQAVEIAVAPDPPAEEVVNPVEEARVKLKAVLDSNPEVRTLEAAIEEASSAGVEAAGLALAQQLLESKKARARARDMLRHAQASLDISELKTAIAEAERTEVGKDEIDKAVAVLAEEEPKVQVREQLRAAQAKGDIGALRSAIDNAKRANLGASEVAPFEDMLAGAENKEKAAQTLQKATEERNVDGLKFAIGEAKKLGVKASLIATAEDVLRDEEPKVRAREQVAKALEDGTKEALEVAIEAAKQASLKEAEYSEAQSLLQVLAERLRLLAEVKQAMDDAKTVDLTSIDALKGAKDRLGAVIVEAKAIGVAEADLSDAEIRRRRIHNAIEDLKGSIRVFCRVRPLSGKEKDAGDYQVTQALDAMTIQCEGLEGGAPQSFQFDAVFTPGSQEEVFTDCKDLVQSAVDGYNVTMFAYGQTGAGKTFTMYGCPGQLGTAPRTIDEIFAVTEQGKDRFTYTVMASMLELYLNDLVDLIGKANGNKNTKLNIRTDKAGAVVIDGATETECTCPQELNDMLDKGNAQRTVAPTAMNSESSRGHLVLIIKIISVNKETKQQLQGKILICDLAGSERIKKSQVSAEGEKEAIEINKSLTALGDVISGLTKASKTIPYRNHKLTMLMQDSLGGTAKTLMFVNCSPANSNLDETLMSLKYAARAKQITNKR